MIDREPARLADVTAVWQWLRDTRSRRAKVTALADLLASVSEPELAIAVSFLAGRPRQGRIGVGYATVHAVAVPPAPAPVLRLVAVDARLDELAAVAGPGSASRRTELLAALLRDATADEQDFLRGLLLHELRQGALESLMGDAVAVAFGVPPTAVRRTLMLSGDLTQVAVRARRGGTAALARVRLTVFRPLQPMLAQTAGSVADALDRVGAVAGDAPVPGADGRGPVAMVDAKLDGARIQVHRADRDVRVFTRSLRDVTREVPRVVAAVAALPVDAVVLDGEAIALTGEDRPRPFQETMSGLSGEEVEVGLVPFFFDCLHLDGDDLIDLPLPQRRAALDRVVPPSARVEGRLVAESADAELVLADAIAAGHEGVVVKSLMAPYEAGRRGGAWVKVKPVHTVDLVVIAAEWGSGRRHGWLSNLHLAARDPATGEPVMLGKTFKGLTDAMLTWQTRRLLALETHRERHVVHVRPELVVEIAFDGVQASSRYPGGVTLRFARVKRHRPDKPAEEANTIATIRAIHAGRST